MKIEKKDLPKGEVEFKIIVDEKELEVHHAKALSNVQLAVEIDGFRKGNAPEDLIVKKYGDMIILEEMANLALREAYVKAITEHKITPISDPQVTITKLAKGNPLELTIVVAVLPEITLPAYKKIAKEAVNDGEKIEVTDKDIEYVVEELRKGRATQNEHVHNENCNHGNVEVAGETDSTEKKDESKNNEAKGEIILPELNDEFAQSFGEGFKTIADLKAKVGENLKLEKEQKLREKRRVVIIEKLIAETKADLPEAVVESELNMMIAQMKQDIARFGGKWEEYLTYAKKSEEQFKADWRNDAVKRAMTQLILHKIAEVEKLHPTQEDVEVELVRLMAQVQDADEERAKGYLYQALTNENVLKFLEESK